MKAIHNREEYQQAIHNDKVSVLLFTAKWCGDCMFIKPFMPALVESYPEYDFYEIDRDEMLELAQELDIMGIPSFVSYKNGKELSRFVSSLRKTKQEIEDYLNAIKDVEEA